MDKTFDTGGDFNECAVVGHNDNFTLNLVTNLEVSVKSIPGMGLELLKTEGDALALVVEVKYYYIEFLIEFNHFFGMAYAAPRKVGDVDKTVNASEVDEYTVSGDVLNDTLEHLTSFEFGDDVLLLLLELGFDKSLVRNDNILEFLVDLYNLEFHSLTNEDIVIADGLYINL